MSLHRIEEGKIIAGVCTGLADALGIDVTIIRIIFAAISVFMGGGILLYIVLWIVMPREGGGTIAADGAGKARQWYDDRKRDRG